MSIALAFKSILSAPSNEKLMVRYAKTGENTLLTQLYDACGDDLYHFVLTLSEPHLAKDICQKTWLKVIEKKHLYSNSGQFKAWLFTLARNQLIDELRSQKLTTDQTDTLPSHQAGAAQTQNQQQLANRFDQALCGLPFEQREAFCLQQEGFSLEQISHITHSKTETIKSRLRYAKIQLRKQLESLEA